MKFTKLKKHLAVILSAAMVFSCFPATAMAAEPSDEAVAVESGAEDEIVGAEAEVEPATEVEEAEISAAEEENIVEEEAEAVEEEIDSAPEEDVDNDGTVAEGVYDYTKKSADPGYAGISGIGTRHSEDHGFYLANSKVTISLSGNASLAVEVYNTATVTSDKGTVAKFEDSTGAVKQGASFTASKKGDHAIYFVSGLEAGDVTLTLGGSNQILAGIMMGEWR